VIAEGIETTTQLEMSDPQISPDGKTIVASSAARTRKRIATTPTSRRLTSRRARSGR
jgi:hypothetical protein